MPSKSFRYILEQTQAWASGYGPGYAEFVIATTDGQVPTSSVLSSGSRVFSNTAPAGTHNIDFANSYVVHINGSPRNDTQKTTQGIRYFEFTNGQLENASAVDPEVLTFSENCKLYFTLNNNDWLWFDPASNTLKYNTSSYGGSPSVGVTVGSVKKVFRSESALQSYINDNILDYVVKLQTLNANMIATTSDKSIYYGSDFGYTATDSTVLYSQFTTPSAGVTFDEIGYALAASANASALSGSVTVQLHAVNISTLRSNPSRTPEAQVQIPLNKLITHRTHAMGKFIFGKLQSAVTLSGSTVHTVKATFSGTGTSSSNGLKANQVYGVTQYSQSSAAGTESVTSGATFPFMLTTEIVPPPSNTAPTDIILSSSTIAENAAANATIGTLSVVDAEGGAMSYSLVSGTGSADNASFMIDGNALKLANGVSVNYEAKSSYSVRIRATDAGDLTYEEEFTISVTNVNEAPSSLQLSSASIQENNALNAVIGSLSVVDPDIGEVIAYSVISGSDKFNISGSQLRASVSFDYEVATSHSVTVRATDAAGLYVEQSFSIAITNQSSDDPVALPGTGLPTLASGQVITTTAANPTVVEVTVNGQPLPVGSVLRNTATGQKFVKVDGGALDFVAIEVEPKVSWGWEASGDAAWEILQAL